MHSYTHTTNVERLGTSHCSHYLRAVHQCSEFRCRQRIKCRSCASSSSSSTTTGSSSSSTIACKGLHFIRKGLVSSLLPRQCERRRHAEQLQICQSTSAAAGVGVFPAGQKQARMDLPALLVHVQASVLLDPEQASQQLSAINEAVTGGATAVVLDGGDNAAALYDAAVKLKDVLRDRAALLLLDRLDIAAAVGAEGVVLSATGVPVVVARKMQSGAALLGRLVTSAEAAVSAAADGANFVLLQDASGGPPAAGELAAARKQQRSGNAIPVIAASSSNLKASGSATSLQELVGTADGFCMPLQELPAAAEAFAGVVSSSSSSSSGAAGFGAAVGTFLQALTEGRSRGVALDSKGSSGADNSSSRGGDAPAGKVAVKVAGGAGSAMRRLLNASKENLIAEERRLLQQVEALLQEVVPQMDELPLLRDAIINLDDVFLVVVVGEFNSGKSTVINALLGEKFLADGILPTTNEISVLKYADPSKKQPELEQQADGLFVRRLPAALLREMNIVDTPGTNVILERQQRLTEEYVPRADLVLFVLSADRPLSESELAFLKYIRQWRKKVVFVINKVDMLEDEEEVGQVISFVSSNASKLLQLDEPAVLPISGRAALKAKLECGAARSGGVLDSWEDDLLGSQKGWQASRFGDFEKFIYDFLVGTEPAAGGGEGLRLKIQTPLYVADALMEAARLRLQGELSAAEGELNALEAVKRQLQRFQGEMAKDAEAQRQVCRNLVAEAINRNNKFVDKTLQLSNLPALTGYLFGGSSSSSSSGDVKLPGTAGWEAEVVVGTFDQLAKQVAEHAAWLSTNCTNQLDYYTNYLGQHQLPGSSSSSSSTNGSLSAEAAAAAYPPQTAVSSSSNVRGSSTAVTSVDVAATAVAAASGSKSLAAVADFKPAAARTLLEAEIREAFLGTAGSAAGAQGLGLLAAGWLGNTLEDLLALTVAGLASYVAVLNLPLKRGDIKAKVAKVANNFMEGVTDAMQQESDSAVQSAVDRVLVQVRPLETAWKAELERLQSNERRRAELAESLQMMEKKAANLQ